MLKHFFNFFLALVMVYSMTGCSANTVIQETTAETLDEEKTSSNEATSERNIDNLNIFGTKIELINPTSLMEMTSQEVVTHMEEMVNISAEEQLTISDMIHMGHNFNNIGAFASDINEDDFEIQAISAFDNVYNQCIEQQIPLEKISSWTNIPIAEIQNKYFSGKFSSVEGVECKALYLLDENDAITVVNTILDNPALFENSSTIVYDIISCPHNEVREIGLVVLTCISQSKEPVDSSITFSFCRMLNTNSIVNDVLSLEKLDEIRKSIIKNENLDFMAKYYAFCNSDDEEVSNWAQASLTEVAKQCNTETSECIKELANYLYDDAFASDLLNLISSPSC